MRFAAVGGGLNFHCCTVAACDRLRPAVGGEEKAALGWETGGMESDSRTAGGERGQQRAGVRALRGRRGVKHTRQKLLKIKNLVFIVRLLGIIDLLRVVKDLSLALQTVNQLPWELEETISSSIARLRLLRDDLRQGKVDRTLPATPRSGGQPVLVFERLGRHLPELRQMKFSMVDPSGSIIKTISIELASEMRAQRSATVGADASQEVATALTSLAGLAEKMADVLEERLKPPSDDAMRIARMGKCLDLRQMASSAAYASLAENLTALDLLGRWMRTRDISQTSLGADIPDFDSLKSQFTLLCVRMRAAYTERPFSCRWPNASGTVLMEDKMDFGILS